MADTEVGPDGEEELAADLGGRGQRSRLPASPTGWPRWGTRRRRGDGGELVPGLRHAPLSPARGASEADWKGLVHSAGPAGRPARGPAVIPVEGGRWLVIADRAGTATTRPPTRPASSRAPAPCASPTSTRPSGTPSRSGRSSATARPRTACGTTSARDAGRRGWSRSGTRCVPSTRSTAKG